MVLIVNPRIVHLSKKKSSAFFLYQYIHVSVSDLWSAYFAAGKYVDRSWEYINRSQTHECGNGTEAAQFLFWENVNEIFFAVHLIHIK
jgi:hypothetical protein